VCIGPTISACPTSGVHSNPVYGMDSDLEQLATRAANGEAHRLHHPIIDEHQNSPTADSREKARGVSADRPRMTAGVDSDAECKVAMEMHKESPVPA